MQSMPHNYEVNATTEGETVVLNSEGCPTLTTTPPPQFGGPEGHWSPESLLVAAVADCFILSFKAIARPSRLEFVSLACTANGTLDKTDSGLQFTAFQIEAKLVLPEGGNKEKAEKLLHKAEQNCLITHSLKAPSQLTATVTVAGE